MQKLHYEIVINAPREKVYETMLGKGTYEEWTGAFNMGGSSYEGDWNVGSTLRFVGPDPENPDVQSGMICTVVENRPNEFVSIKPVGMIMQNKETAGGAMGEWDNAFENYTFEDVDGGTKLSVDQDTPAEFVEEFSTMWPKGLEKLKEICER